MSHIRRICSILLKTTVFLCATLGVAIQCGFTQGFLDFSCLTYFTLMTNAACMIYYLHAANRAIRGGCTLWPMSKGALLMCVTVTGLVYHFMLNGRFEMQGTVMLSNLLLHYAVPIGTILDWLLFDRKGSFTPKMALLWQLVPLCYTIFVYIAVAFGAVLGPYGEPYPYFFLDVEKQGLHTVTITIVIMGVCFYLLSMGIVLLDRSLAKAKQHK